MDNSGYSIFKLYSSTQGSKIVFYISTKVYETVNGVRTTYTLAENRKADIQNIWGLPDTSITAIDANGNRLTVPGIKYFSEFLIDSHFFQLG